MPETPAQWGAAETSRIGRRCRCARAGRSPRWHTTGCPQRCSWLPGSPAGRGDRACPAGRVALGARAVRRRRRATLRDHRRGTARTARPRRAKVFRLFLLRGSQDLGEACLDLLFELGDRRLLLRGQLQFFDERRRQHMAQLEARRTARRRAVLPVARPLVPAPVRGRLGGGDGHRQEEAPKGHGCEPQRSHGRSP